MISIMEVSESCFIKNEYLLFTLKNFEVVFQEEIPFNVDSIDP